MATPKTVRIELSEEEAAELSSRLRRRKVARVDAMRAEIVLLAAQGVSNLAISERLGITRVTAATWRRRFTDRRLDDLQFHTGFLPHGQSLALRMRPDRAARPSKKASSAALRTALTMSVPIAVSRVALFDAADETIMRPDAETADSLARNGTPPVDAGPRLAINRPPPDRPARRIGAVAGRARVMQPNQARRR